MNSRETPDGGRPGDAAAPMDVPLRIGPYRVLAPIGEGGMGVVYRARHETSGAVAAVKTVTMQAEDNLQSIRREVQALARVRHPGIVRIIDEGVDDGRPWYAMELVEGTSLRGLLARQHAASLAGLDGAAAELRTARTALSASSTESQPGAGRPGELAWVRTVLPEGSEAVAGDVAAPDDEAQPLGFVRTVLARPSGSFTETEREAEPAAPPGRARLGTIDALDIIRRLCSPLAFLHGEGIVHRDLKPDNVLVTPELRVVLVDFGLAGQFEGRLELELSSHSALRAGTLAYMAPEIAEGATIDARADLYSLGCMLFELLVGHPPFTGTPGGVLRAHRTAPIPSVRAVVGELGAPLDELLARLLAKDPRDRLGYAEDVAAALARLGARAPSAPGPRPRPHVYRPGYRGRATLRAEIAGRVDAASEGQGSIVLVGGESGSGKTRLVVEAATAAAQGGRLTVLTGQCVDAGSRPLEGLIRPLEALADRCRTRGPDETERIFGPRRPLLTPYVTALAGLPARSHHPPPPALPPHQARERLFKALAESLEAATAEHAVLVMVDDLHWADELTIGFVGMLAGRIASHREAGRRVPLAVLATWRSEETREDLAGLVTRPDVARVMLTGLDEPDVSAIVADMLAIAEPSPRFVQFLARASEGNPFFVAEYLRTAVEEGLLHRDADGRWQVLDLGELEDDARFDALPIPRELRQVIERRLAGLGRHAMDLAQAASVLGRTFELALALGLSALPETTGLAAASELVRRQIVEEFEPGQFRFLHDKLREVAYSEVPEAQRRALHGAVAELLQRRHDGPATTGERAAMIAVHYLRAERWAEALHYHRLAARHAFRSSALGEAVALGDAALRIVDRLPAGPARDQLFVDVRLEAWAPRFSLRSAADERLLAIALEAVDGAARLDDPLRECDALTQLGGCRFGRADFERASVALERALELSRTAGALDRIAASSFVLAASLLQMGRFTLAVEIGENVGGRLEAAGVTTEFYGQPYPPYVGVRAIAGASLAYLGDPAAMRGSLDDARRAAATAPNNRYALAAVAMMAGFAALALGDEAGAVDCGARCARLGHEGRLPAAEIIGRIIEGAGLVLGGQVDEGLAITEAAIRRGDEVRYLAMRSDAWQALVQGSLARRRYAHAAETCDRWQAYIHQTGEQKLAGELQRWRAELALAAGDEIDLQWLTSAARIAEQQRSPVLAGKVRWTEARVLMARGEADAALARLEPAITMFQELGIPGWLQRTQAERARILDGRPR